MRIQKKFIDVNGQCIHYRFCGNGMPLVLLHASPMSSKRFEPLMHLLSADFLVIAPDSPGYGLSQPLSDQFSDMKSYADFWDQFFITIGLEKFSIYGDATGAQMAIRYGLEYPEKVDYLYLDNAGHFTEDQKTRLLESYFPDLSPQADGSHLKKIWEITTGLFEYFPWCLREEEFKLSGSAPSTQTLNDIAKDYLLAGADYDRAHRAAFDHQRSAYVQLLSTKGILFNWKGSLLESFTKQLIEEGLPDNMGCIEIPEEREARFTKMIEIITSTYTNGKAVNLKHASPNKKKGQAYYAFERGDLHYFYNLNSEEKPLLILHPNGSSAAVIKAQLDKKFGDDLSFVVVSRPGHGNSDFFGSAVPEEQFADMLHKIMVNLNFLWYNVSAPDRSELANYLIDEGAIDWVEFPVEKKEPLGAIILSEDGTHLTKAWNTLMQNNKGNIEQSHLELQELLKLQVI